MIIYKYKKSLLSPELFMKEFIGMQMNYLNFHRYKNGDILIAAEIDFSSNRNI